MQFEELNALDMCTTFSSSDREHDKYVMIMAMADACALLARGASASTCTITARGQSYIMYMSG